MAVDVIFATALLKSSPHLKAVHMVYCDKPTLVEGIDSFQGFLERLVIACSFPQCGLLEAPFSQTKVDRLVVHVERLERWPPRAFLLLHHIILLPSSSSSYSSTPPSSVMSNPMASQF